MTRRKMFRYNRPFPLLQLLAASKLAKISQHGRKERLKSQSKVAKFKSDLVENERRYISAKLRNFTDVCLAGENSRLCGAISLVVSPLNW